MLLGDGNKFVIVEETTSTNDELASLIKQNSSEEGTVIFALKQTNARGMRGNSWNSKPGENITMSILLTPNADVQSQFELDFAIAVGVCKFARNILGNGVYIKWPNDIYNIGSDFGKISGILIENSIESRTITHSIIGIGFNVNQTEFEPMPTNPKSLRMLTQVKFDVIALAKQLCNFIEIEYLKYKSGILLKSEYLGMLYRNDSAFTSTGS
ncbi:MAG: biotin--[acetyl-CoA-carboxylase] ligase [Bacteroidetes bacterium]|nr:biotin--[acetyl-CoA-carboxylase] ligase [Bacteroidota bacterium]